MRNSESINTLIFIDDTFSVDWLPCKLCAKSFRNKHLVTCRTHFLPLYYRPLTVIVDSIQKSCTRVLQGLPFGAVRYPCRIELVQKILVFSMLEQIRLILNHMHDICMWKHMYISDPSNFFLYRPT